MYWVLGCQGNSVLIVRVDPAIFGKGFSDISLTQKNIFPDLL